MRHENVDDYKILSNLIMEGVTQFQLSETSETHSD